MPWTVVHGRRIYFEESGQGDPLIFLAGLGGDHRAFSLAVRHFKLRFRTLAIDSRDSGQSDRAGGPFSVADMAGDVAALMVQLGLPPAHVVGHSLGGMVAQELAIRSPELVRSLVLASTHAGADAWRRALLDSWVIMRKRTDASTFTRVTLPWLVGPWFYQHHASQVEGLIRFAERNDRPDDAEAFERLARAAAGHSTRDRLAKVGATTLVLNGESDIVNPPAFAQELVERIGDSRLAILPRVGHLPHIEDGPAFRSAIDDFLA